MQVTRSSTWNWHSKGFELSTELFVASGILRLECCQVKRRNQILCDFKTLNTLIKIKIEKK